MESTPTDAQPEPQTQYNNNYHKKSYRGRGNYRGGYRGGRGNRGSNRGYNNNSNNYRGGQGFRGGYNNQPQNQSREYVNPYIAQEMIYRAEMYIYTKYSQLININVKSTGWSKLISDKDTFYVIKSFSEEDVHKSIKYGVWSSSKNGNVTLSNSFKMAEEKGGNVYLFFSCNGSGRFIGVSKMKSQCDNDKSFEYWTQDGKWPGLFEVEWVFIKDTPFNQFKNIVITMKDGEKKPISNARDVQEVPFEEAKTMMEIFEMFQNTHTVLEHFEYYDTRQDNYEKQIKMNQQQGQIQAEN